MSKEVRTALDETMIGLSRAFAETYKSIYQQITESFEKRIRSAQGYDKTLSLNVENEPKKPKI